MNCCFFHWILVKIYKMNKNINSLDYFHFFIQTHLLETVSAKNSSTTSSAVYRLPQAAVLPSLHSYPLGNTLCSRHCTHIHWETRTF
jgi:hypothetical protein